MIGPMYGLIAKPPCPGPEDQHKQEEEDAGNLEEDDAADSAEGLEESAYPSRHASGGSPSGASGHPAAARRSRYGIDGYRLP